MMETGTHRIDVVTTARADYSLVLPVVRALRARAGTQTRIVFTGSHFSRNERPGLSQLLADAGEPAVTVDCEAIGRDAVASAAALGQMTRGFAELWAHTRPNLVTLLGDRFELLAPASVAVMYGIPLAHLYGGEEDVAYCFDTQVRNGVTKMAHVHCVMHEAQRERLVAMGEEPWRISVCGNTAIEGIEGLGADADKAFAGYAAEHGLGKEPIIAACYLPATAVPGIWKQELAALLEALAGFPDHAVIWAGVNADPESAEIQDAIEAHCHRHRNHRFEANLGRLKFYGLLRKAAVLAGNSSSGLLEAASFGLPVVNVGIRQTGRLSGANVENVPAQAEAIREALSRAVADAAYRATVARLANPFSRTGAASAIADRLLRAARMPRAALLLKRTALDNPSHVGGLRRVRELAPLADMRGDRLEAAGC